MIIPFDNKFEFAFLEDKDVKYKHPVSDYFLKINDLSVNLLISLKWIEWAYIFFNELSENLKNNYNFKLTKIITNPLQLNLQDMKNLPHILLIDNVIIKDNNEFINLINTFYKDIIFEENTKIHLKLKINLNEYLLISNLYFPTLVKYK